MKIGITYDLRSDYLAQGYSKEETAEFDSEETISALAETLQTLNCEVELIGNVKNLLQALQQEKRWDLVFNIAEGLHGIAREAQVPAILDAYCIPYTFSDVVTISCSLNKSIAKRIVRDHAIPTADFQVIHHLSDLNNFNLELPVFVKPIAEGTSKGISAKSFITSHDELHAQCHYLLTTFKQPVLVEKYLSGREFTVAVFGNGQDAQAFGAMEIMFHEKAEKHSYSYINKEFYEDKISYRLAIDAEAELAAKTALQAYLALQCRDAARIDLRSDEKQIPHFIEANPIAGLNPTRSDLVILMKFLGYDYKECIARILNAARGRIMSSRDLIAGSRDKN